MKPDETNYTTAQESLEALFTAIEAGPEAALKQLGGKTDADSIQRILVILIESQRYSEASDIIRGKQPSEKWCDLAIMALIENEEREEAKRLMRFSQTFENRIKRDLCRLTFAEVVFQFVFQHRDGDGIIFPETLTQAERKEFLEVNDALMPLAVPIEATTIVNTEFDQRIVELALRVSHLLGQKARCNELVKLLLKRSPVPLVVAEAVLGEWVDGLSHETLTQRLISEYPSSFHARFFAVLIERAFQKNSNQAFQKARELINFAKTPDEKLQLFHALDTMAITTGDEAKQFVSDIAPRLLAEQDSQLKRFRAKNLLKSGKWAEAGELLTQIRDDKDVNWLQAWADYKLQRGEPSDALTSIKKAIEVQPHPALYWRAAEIACSLEKYSEAANLIRQQLIFDNKDVRARFRLANILWKNKEYSDAANEFKILQELEPSNNQHALSRARILLLANRTDESLAIYEGLCEQENPPLEAVVGKAEILKAKNRANEGFKGLAKVKDRYWDDPRFLWAYMDTAYAAGRDADASKVFIRLQELQNQNKIAKEALKAVPFDEVISYMREAKQKRDELLKCSLEGKLPWLLIEQMIGRVPYWGWYLRTQPLNWQNDESLFRAEYSIYSTNTFSISKVGSGDSFLERMECPGRGSPVVIDLSALITLHQLGLLPKAAEYFGKLLIPMVYVEHLLEDSAKLVIHQKSHKTSLAEIRKLLDSRQIKVASEDGLADGNALTRMSEYDEQELHCYRIKDVAEILSQHGEITKVQYEATLQVAHRPARVDEIHPPLSATQQILLDPLTLQTLFSVGVLNSVVKFFSVYILPNHREAIMRELRGFELYEEVYRSHSDMWQVIGNDKRFAHVSSAPPELAKKINYESDRDIYLSAYFLAAEQKMPLLVDDRFCQTISINERKDLPHSSFGTDVLLESLRAEKMLTDDEAADAFIKLLEWRYRFIVVPPELLKTLALRHIKNVPGISMRDVARYVHDCMRDPGLLAGLEPTSPPSSIGVRLFFEWANTVVQLVFEMWEDQSIDQTTLETFTRWAVLELLPSPPRTMGDSKAQVIASLLPRSVMAHSFIRSIGFKNEQRTNSALLCIASALGISKEEYSKALLQVIEGVDREHK